MHPTLSYHLAQARTADLRHRAQRDTLARAARRARPGRCGYAVPRWPAGWRLATSRPVRSSRPFSRDSGPHKMFATWVCSGAEAG